MKSKAAKPVFSPARAARPAPPALLTDICRALDDKKAGDLRVLCVRAQSTITDYLVLATGNSEPHLRALRVELEKVIDQAKVRIVGMDTGDGSGWLVVDAFDIMVHVLTPENREKYALERLWKDAEEISVSHLLNPAAPVLAELPVRAAKAAKPAKAPKAGKKPAKAVAAKKVKAKAPAKPRATQRKK